jgi:P-type conjugative transfer protein TrbG
MINRDNLRDATIAALGGCVLAWLLSGCAGQQPQPSPMPTAAQLAPEPTPAPRITGAMVLAQQSPEIQQAIRHGQPWPSFRWPRERLVPYTDHMRPLTITVAPFQDVDLTLQPGEQIAGFALGDSEEFTAAPIITQAPHIILKCKVSGKETSGAIYTERNIYRVHLLCRDKTPLDSISYYYPETVLAEMHAADAAAATPPQETDPIAPTVDPSRLNLAYKIDGPSNISWKPVRALDDGAHVWIEMPRMTSPIAPIVSGDDGAVLNSRLCGRYLVVDSLFNRATLTDGSDKVTISRSGQ